MFDGNLSTIYDCLREELREQFSVLLRQADRDLNLRYFNQVEELETFVGSLWYVDLVFSNDTFLYSLIYSASFEKII